MMIFRQLFDPESSTYTYLLGDEATREAALIDPVLEQLPRDLAVLRELELKLAYVLDTHVHADHITAAGSLRAQTGAQTVSGRKGASCADVQVGHGDEVRFGSIRIEVLETPGHTDDSVSYRVANHIFTGDALIIRGAGRTDFQNGDAGQLYESITRRLFSLPDATQVHPAHDYKGLTVSTIGEEKRWNVRIAGRSKEGFIALMNGLHLPKPRKIDVAVPANRSCGLAADRVVRDIEPGALGAGQAAGRLIDVRERAEFEGELGHLPGAELVAMAKLKVAAAQWNRDEPIYLVCRSGRRSAAAAAELLDLGFTCVFSVRGGMEAATAAGIHVERREQRLR
jgi:glyoxylase-like metal-dependent hydrolase (beta-lactamase superfamily II)/rhodanese-related sulfurtransferase